MADSILGQLLNHKNKQIANARKGQRQKAIKKVKADIEDVVPHTRSIDVLTEMLNISNSESSKEHIFAKEWVKQLAPLSLEFSGVDCCTKWLTDMDEKSINTFTKDFIRLKTNVYTKERENRNIANIEQSISSDEETQKEYEYCIAPSQYCFKSQQFVFDYLGRLPVNPNHGLTLEGTGPNELAKILQNNADLFMIDPHGAEHDELGDVIIAHIVDKLSIHQKAKNEAKEMLENGKDYRQLGGFVRPTILILASYRYEAHELVMRLANVCQQNLKDSLLEKLDKNYISEDQSLNGNFCFSLRLQPAIKIFKNPFAGDIIITSSQALINIGDDAKSLLSSLATLLLFNAHNIELQNVESLNTVLQMLNRRPVHHLITEDFRFLSPIFNEEKSVFFRQSIVLSDYNTSQLHALSSRHFQNLKGIFRRRLFFQGHVASINWLVRFHRFSPQNYQQELSEKLNYFENSLWDHLRNQQNLTSSLIFVNNYLEYQKLRSILRKKRAPFVSVSEHSSPAKAQSAAALLANGKVLYLLTTERAFFFDVIKPKSLKAIIFYGLPFNPDILEKLSERANKVSVFVLFSEKSYYELEVFVGSLKASELIAKQNANREFRL